MGKLNASNSLNDEYNPSADFGGCSAKLGNCGSDVSDLEGLREIAFVQFFRDEFEKQS